MIQSITANDYYDDMSRVIKISDVRSSMRINGLEMFLGKKMPMWKRTMDIAGSAMGLAVLSPLFLIFSIMIKVVSRGPVFFRQKRVGHTRRTFTLWKFRTMEVDNDLRIIPFGKILQKLCIDKLPQLINVFLGEMSLVGPCPPTLGESEEYLQWHRKRFDVVPGITGLWQIRRKRQTSFDEMVRLDIRYTKQLSFRHDRKILIRALFNVALQIKNDLSIQDKYIKVKPLLEPLVAIIGLAFVFPLLFVVSVIIKATSRGPVFYTQERVGKDGRFFKIIKFRSMNVNAESKAGPVWAEKNDTRMTFIGRILRKTHIDEIPQLINIIKGEMCLIGPRPERPFFVNKFKTDIVGYTKRLAVKPGIAGLAQCCHRADETIKDVHKKLRYDLIYIKKVCLLLDLKILLLTFRLCLFGKMAR